MTVVRSPVEAAVEASKGWPRVNLPRPGRTQELVPVPGIGFTSSKTLTPPVLRTPPRSGADTRVVLGELGFSSEEVDQLIAAGVAAEPV
ncbi:hypothetical protein LP417_18090 [Polaromonas sp. P1-6]|nr:hypothetical protein LP417_18090 [Polaromonas sp. P1-6]